MLRSQKILYPSASAAKPNPINTLRVTDTLAGIQAFGCWVMVPSVIILTCGGIAWSTWTVLHFHLDWVLSSDCNYRYGHFWLDLPCPCNFLLRLSVFVFTSHTGRLGHNTLPPLCLWNAGLWGYKGRRGVRAVDLRQGHANPRLRAFLKSTCFVLLHTGTPLAPLTQFALWSTLTCVGKKMWQRPG